MTAAEAKVKIDNMISGGTLRRWGNAEERATLDALYKVAFGSQSWSNGNTSAPKVWSSEGPVSNSDYFPTEIAAIVVEKEKVIQKNEARRLLGEVHAAIGSKSHPYWNEADPSHQAWVNGITVITGIAGDD